MQTYRLPIILTLRSSALGSEADRHACSFSYVLLARDVFSPFQALSRSAACTRVDTAHTTLYSPACRRPCISPQLVQAALQTVTRQRVYGLAEGRAVGLFDHLVVSRRSCWSRLIVLQQMEMLMTLC